MNISGIGVIQAQLLQNQDTSTSQGSSSLQNLLLNAASSTYSLSALQSQDETFHMEIELKDGTTVTIDYARQGVVSKTSYELGQYGNYTYGNDYTSPENTANRILDFARDLWDGSTEQLEVLAGAIEEGVSQAREALGSLPSWIENLIGRTVDLLNEGIAQMKSEAQAQEAA